MSHGDRNPRALQIPDSLRTALARLRVLHDKKPAPDIDLSQLVEVERALGYQFSDEILALFAIGIEELREHAMVSLERVVSVNKAATRAGLPSELVCFGGHPDGKTYYCVPKQAGSDDDDENVVLFDPTEKATATHPLRAWLQAKVELRREYLRDGDPAERLLAKQKHTPEEVAALKLSLVTKTTEKPRRVQHKTLGAGEVLREIDSGPNRKLEVRFADSTKILLARVLQEID